VGHDDRRAGLREREAEAVRERPVGVAHMRLRVAAG
jgi:hypothetical protein